MIRVSLFAARAVATVRVAALVLPIAAAMGAAAGCKSEERTPEHIGFVAPPAATPTVAATTTATGTPQPAFTSFFHDTVEASAPVTTAVPSASTVRMLIPVDPDTTALAAVRSRANACFPSANIPRGGTRTVSFAFVVLATGRVSRFDVSGADVNDGAFYTCLQGVGETATFPEKADAGTDIRTLSVTASATAS